MKTKDNKKVYIFLSIVVTIFVIICCCVITKNNSYATETYASNSNVQISNAIPIDIYEIINKNTNQTQREEIEVKEEVLEFMTTYRTNKELPKGMIQVIQEGREGLQEITTKNVYNNGELINKEQIATKVTKASIDKIVEIGGASYESSYKVKVGDKVYTTADRMAVMLEPEISSQKLATLPKNTELKVLSVKDDWYKIISSYSTGWVKKESTTYIDPNSKANNTSTGEKSRQQLLNTFSFNMSLNKPSGLSLKQFKKILTDSRDKYKIFEKNAEYFYYIEKQYNINGVFVAAIGIHESAWGTSTIAQRKTNLFGYGAYDSDPYNKAYTFKDHAAGIDLLARVLTKYYLNPAGTKIYNNERAKGTYYNGPTFSGVNKRYATDKNWANAVYHHMKYLYEKI